MEGVLENEKEQNQAKEPQQGEAGRGGEGARAGGKKVWSKPRTLTKEKGSQSSMAAYSIIKEVMERTGQDEGTIVGLVVKIQVFFFFFFFFL